jgi:hypothetical protein
MGIDSSIAMGVKPIQIEDPMNALAKMMQIKDAQQASQLNTLKMDEYQRGVTNQNALRQLMSGFGDDHAANQSKLLKGGFLKESKEYGESQSKIAKEKVDAGKGEAEILDKNLALFRSYVPQIRTPEEAGQYAAAMYEHPILGRYAAQFGQRDEVVKRNIEAFAKDPREWVKGAAGISADKLAEMMKGTRQNVNLGGTSQGTTTNYYGELVPDQTTSTPITQSADNKASQATAMRGQNMVDSRARETNQISRELGITEKQLKIDEMREKATDRSKQKQAAAAAVEGQIGVIDKALNHKGRTTGTGLSGSIDPRNYIPGTDATDFKVVVDQLGGAAFLQAFESLKGGGQITEMEGKKATDAIARLNRSQSDKEFETALKDLRQVMSDGLSRMKSGSATPSGNAPAAPTAPGATNAKGWTLMTDAKGNRAYVSPDGKQFEEVR